MGELQECNNPSGGTFKKNGQTIADKEAATDHFECSHVTSLTDDSYRDADTSLQSSKSPRAAMSNRAAFTALDKTHRTLLTDDEESKGSFFALLLVQSVGGSAPVFIGSTLFVLVWSVLCAWGGQRLHRAAEADPGGAAERWVEDIENGRTAVSILGTIFVFAVVFRFNVCYDRWWEGRIHWGDIVSKSLDLATMGRSWIVDEELAARMSRFIVLFGYASKSLLRETSLGEEGGDGADLVRRGLMTQEELDDMHGTPCWQPYYCLHMIRLILVQVHNSPGGKALTFNEGNKVHGQMFRCFDNTIKDLSRLIGNCVRVRASGMPASYDVIVVMSYFAFFMAASVVWGVYTGWLSPIIVNAASVVLMFLIVMGTNLVSPVHSKNTNLLYIPQ